MADLTTNEPFTHKYVGARYISVFDGEWESNKAYEALTIVWYMAPNDDNTAVDKRYYISTRPIAPTTVTPDTSDFWAEVFVGPTGLKGDAATINVGNVESLPYGTNPYVINTGDENNAVFDFGLERGPQGEQGPQGETGPQGPQGDTYELTETDKENIAIMVYNQLVHLDEEEF